MDGTLTSRPPSRIESPAVTPNSDLESMRRDHLKTENLLKTLGAYFFMGAVAFFLTGLVYLVEVIRQLQQGAPGFLTFTTAGVLLVALPAFMIQTGIKLKQLDPSARKQASIMAILGLILAPLGSILNIVLLYLIDSPKSNTVLSPNYSFVMEQTPHIESRVSRRFVGFGIAAGVVALPLTAFLLLHPVLPI